MESGHSDESESLLANSEKTSEQRPQQQPQQESSSLSNLPKKSRELYFFSAREQQIHQLVIPNNKNGYWSLEDSQRVDFCDEKSVETARENLIKSNGKLDARMKACDLAIN